MTRTNRKPRILVIDGYAEAGRDDLRQGGATTAGELYVSMLQDCSPVGAECDIHYPAERGTRLEGGARLRDYDAVAWTGSSLTAYKTDDERVRAQIEIAGECFAEGIPAFGSCWAVHMAAMAAGGRVAAHPEGREMGVARKIHLTPEGRGHPLYNGKPSVFDAFISHDDEVTHMPAAGVVLATAAYTRVQALTVRHRQGTFWAVQYHPEYDLHELARLTYCRIEKLTRYGFFRDRDAALDYVDKLEALHQDPGRKDLAWQLGIDADVMDPAIRQCEVRNWIAEQVLPTLPG